MQANRPIVLSLSGHDPCGGAGIQADVEAIAAQGCRATSAITCLTVQNTVNVQQLNPVSSELFTDQARVVLEDLPVAAIKIGALGSAGIAQCTARILAGFPRLPVVLDPVLAAGGGASLAEGKLLDAIARALLPLTTLATPNRMEARLLATNLSDQGPGSPDEWAYQILQTGCKAVLVTGADESNGGQVDNILYHENKRLVFQWPRLPGQYHGSGCTLAAAIAARLALGEAMQDAVEYAQTYTWNTLQESENPGHGQSLPNRLASC